MKGEKTQKRNCFKWWFCIYFSLLLITSTRLLLGLRVQHYNDLVTTSIYKSHTRAAKQKKGYDFWYNEEKRRYSYRQKLADKTHTDNFPYVCNVNTHANNPKSVGFSLLLLPLLSVYVIIRRSFVKLYIIFSLLLMTPYAYGMLFVDIEFAQYEMVNSFQITRVNDWMNMGKCLILMKFHAILFIHFLPLNLVILDFASSYSFAVAYLMRNTLLLTRNVCVCAIIVIVVGKMFNIICIFCKVYSINGVWALRSRSFSIVSMLRA